MTATQQSLQKRLRYILYRGLNEARNLALGGCNEQIFELADAMEILPRYFEECSEEDLELIRFVLQNYQTKFPHSNNRYIAILEGEQEPPERY
jgi:hypothetical protein